MTTQLSQKRPAASKVLWAILITLATIVPAVVSLSLWIAYASRSAQFVISPRGLQIRGSMYGRSIPRDQLMVSQARIVNLDFEGGLALARRTNGTAVPGYTEGWFQLADGRKALVFVTRRSQVVLVPTTEDYIVLLSPVRPEMLLTSLRAGNTVRQSFAIVPASTGPLIFVLLAVAVPLVGLVPIVALLKVAAGQARAIPQPIGPGVLYADRLVEITDDAILFRVYYFPWGAKIVPFSEIESIQPFALTFWNGKWRIWGTGDFRTWWPADWDRPRRDRAFLLASHGKRVRMGFTVEDPAQVEAILRAKGLLRHG